MVTEGYCIKCRKKTAMKETTNTKTKRGTPMVRGVCSVCGTKMCRIGG